MYAATYKKDARVTPNIEENPRREKDYAWTKEIFASRETRLLVVPFG